MEAGASDARQPVAILAQPMVRRSAIFAEMYFREGNTIN
jgi:hypothetical protein